MRIVIALGGNALLRRGEPLTAENQQKNIRLAAVALAPLVHEHQVVITHGNGPQVGLLALQGAAWQPDETYPLDVLDAETEGMIGYLVEQELANLLPEHRHCATLLTRIEVDAHDPAFAAPSKPIGPVYSSGEAEKLAAERGWHIAADGDSFRRVVASPRPVKILEQAVIDMLVKQGVVIICAGGGGIPVVRRDNGSFVGVEAVIDKDLASSLLARELQADFFLMLTDVDAVYDHWETENARAIRSISASEIKTRSYAPGSMTPKVQAAVEFVEQGRGNAAIGSMQDAVKIIDNQAGTLITAADGKTSWW